MIKREAENALKRLAGEFPVVAITGPRQSGKSTLAQNTFPQKRYVSFDDQDTRELAAANPKDFIRAFPDGVIIDEVQKVPELFDAVKLAVDSQEFEPGKYILTGSSQFRIKERIRESLAGRIGLLKLLPFSIKELKDACGLSEDPYDYVFRGLYPPLYDDRKHFYLDDWFENYIDTYLDLDVKDSINVSNVSSFRKFIQICALYSGRIVNYEEISRDVGITGTTVKSWMSILEASYIVHFLEPDANNLGKAVLKSPKMYFVDPGLLCYLLRLDSKEELLLDSHKGAAVETLAVSELLKQRFNNGKKANLTYFRDKNGFEVDAIGDWKHAFAIEIKSNSNTAEKLSSNVRKYVKLKGDHTQPMVFYLGDITAEIDGVRYVSWKDWGSIGHLL